LHYIQIALAIALVIYSIVLHEIAHGMAAFLLGDPTAKMLGRLSLNPIKHIDPFHTIIMPILVFALSRGAFLYGGAKPVPVNPRMFRDYRKGMMITSLAGPATNLLIMLTCVAFVRFFAVLAREGAASDLSYFFLLVFYHAGAWNLVLAAFNLMPVPPLDGSRIVAYLLPPGLAHSYERLERYGMMLPMIMAFFLFSYVYRYVADFYEVLTGLSR
jgi:Zn-dependent protease